MFKMLVFRPLTEKPASGRRVLLKVNHHSFEREWLDYYIGSWDRKRETWRILTAAGWMSQAEFERTPAEDYREAAQEGDTLLEWASLDD